MYSYRIFISLCIYFLKDIFRGRIGRPKGRMEREGG